MKREAEDRFRLIERVGAGGMGAVYRVRDRNLLREAAMKLLNPSLATRPKYLQRFLGESQIQAQLEHPNILPVHELALDRDGASYFTMRFVKGKTLAAWIREAAASRTLASHQHEMLSAFLKVCDALAFAHSRGVIHCDIKPDNIIVEDFGAVYLMDWGLARLVAGAGTGKTAVAVSPEVWAAVSSGGVIGTPAFMSPEQARGDADRLDARTDVFGLGAVLHAIITGRAPHACPRAPRRRWPAPRPVGSSCPAPAPTICRCPPASGPCCSGRWPPILTLATSIRRNSSAMSSASCAEGWRSPPGSSPRARASSPRARWGRESRPHGEGPQVLDGWMRR